MQQPDEVERALRKSYYDIKTRRADRGAKIFVSQNEFMNGKKTNLITSVDGKTFTYRGVPVEIKPASLFKD